MIIDAILDRRGGFEYRQEEISYILQSVRYFDFYYITRAFDSKCETLIKAALCYYIDTNEYNPEIKSYINSVIWKTPDNENKKED